MDKAEQQLGRLSHALWRDAEDEAQTLRTLLTKAHESVCSLQCRSYFPPGYVEPPELHWGEGEQRLHPTALERYGYQKARRIGMMAMIGGKDKKRIRNTTPPAFRDLLLSIARGVSP